MAFRRGGGGLFAASPRYAKWQTFALLLFPSLRSGLFASIPNAIKPAFNYLIRLKNLIKKNSKTSSIIVATLTVYIN